MTNEYTIEKGKGVVGIHLNTYFDSFIEIWCDEIGILSPFKTVDDAEIFAEAIVKLLKSVDVMVDKDDS